MKGILDILYKFYRLSVDYSPQSWKLTRPSALGMSDPIMDHCNWPFLETTMSNSMSTMSVHYVHVHHVYVHDLPNSPYHNLTITISLSPSCRHNLTISQSRLLPLSVTISPSPSRRYHLAQQDLLSPHFRPLTSSAIWQTRMPLSVDRRRRRRRKPKLKKETLNPE